MEHDQGWKHFAGNEQRNIDYHWKRIYRCDMRGLEGHLFVINGHRYARFQRKVTSVRTHMF